MQIKGLFLVTFSSVATATTFHDGSQAPHARVAVEERHYYQEEPAASSLFRPHNTFITGSSFTQRQPYSADDDLPQMTRDDVSTTGILSRNPKYSHVARLKSRTEALYFGLHDSSRRDETFREMNSMREQDGLPPLSYEDVMNAKEKKRKMHQLRLNIWKREQGIRISQDGAEQLDLLKTTDPELYKTINIQINTRKEMDKLLQLNRPLTREETAELDRLSQVYTAIREHIHRIQLN